MLGDKTRKPLTHLVRSSRIQPLPESLTIYHYSYIGSRPQGKLGPMHPKRVAAWDAEFAKIAAKRRVFERTIDRFSRGAKYPLEPLLYPLSYGGRWLNQGV